MLPENYGFKLQKLQIDFSNTKPNSPFKGKDNWIDFDGNFYYKNDQGYIIVRGGDDKGIYSKNSYEESNFYLTQAQRKTITKILKGMSNRSDIAEIQSNNGTLQEMCIAIYRNFIN